METYQQQFIELCLKHQILRFGEFTLKSGRISPYFFNAGLFNTGASIAELGSYYAESIKNSTLEFDILFGPAYKGIPLVTSTAIALATQHQKNLPLCFNRKEIKDHGEGGQLIGASLKDQRVLIIDDVMTAGTAFREAHAIINQHGGEIVGVALALDRQERGKDGDLSAVQTIQQQYQIPVFSIIKLDHLISYFSQQLPDPILVANMKAYRQQYGV